jgi:hypothetical protein
MEIVVSDDFVREALQARFDQVSGSWVSEAAEDLWEEYLDHISMCDELLDDATPMTIVDNYLVNGEFHSWEDFFEDEYEDDDELEELKDKYIDRGNYIVYNDDYVMVK